MVELHISITVLYDVFLRIYHRFLVSHLYDLILQLAQSSKYWARIGTLVFGPRSRFSYHAIGYGKRTDHSHIWLF